MKKEEELNYQSQQYFFSAKRDPLSLPSSKKIYKNISRVSLKGFSISKIYAEKVVNKALINLKPWTCVIQDGGG